MAPSSKPRRPRGPSDRRPRVTAARLAAARALVAIDGGAWSDQALAANAPADPRERGHAWFLTLGVLQRRGQIDAALRPLVSRPIDGLDPELRAVLRLGTFELLFARTARHAAVSQGVELSRALGLGRASGMANAVLRRVSPAEKLSLHEELDHPAWLVARWTARYGAEAARRWCEANGRPPPLSVVFCDPPDEPLLERWRQADLDLRAGSAAGQPLAGCWVIEGLQGGVEALPGFVEGAFWVQDPAAVAVADLVQARPGMRILDACAAPGGKSLRLASAGAQVVAVDRPERTARLRASIERIGHPIQVVEHDWLSPEPPPLGARFDAVLVDAPCTGLGTVRRHPEIRWRRQPVDLPRMAQRQAAILRAALRWVAPGGRLIYAVCSPEPEEGTEIVAGLVSEVEVCEIVTSWSSAPPSSDEDAHAAWVIRLTEPVAGRHEPA